MSQEKLQQLLQQLLRCTTELLNRDQACWGQYLQFQMSSRQLHQSLLIAHRQQACLHIANDSTITGQHKLLQHQAIYLSAAHSLLKYGELAVAVSKICTHTTMVAPRVVTQKQPLVLLQLARHFL
jgi:hypothetical protein